MLLEKPCSSSTITIGTLISRSMETVLARLRSDSHRNSTAAWYPSKRPSAPEGERRGPDS
jgi:hypothetical protein